MPDPFGVLPSGETVSRVRLENGRLGVSVLTYGATLQSIEVPGRGGVRGDVALGFDTLDEYVRNGGHLGAVPGRYAGRIAYGRFTLDGVAHQLTVNKPPHTLHGGRAGFGKRNWTLVAHTAEWVELLLDSADGEEGFPGRVQTRVRYGLEGDALCIDYHAETDRPTIINLTNHSYFNLAGEGSGDILGHVVTLESSQILPIAADGIPTGAVMDVEGTPFDFRRPHPIGARIRDAHPQLMHGAGYDHAYLLPGDGLRRAATLHEPGTGRTLTVSTTEPVMHFYSGNNLPATFAGRSGRIYRPCDGVCFEAEHPQDSPNHPGFASTVLRPGTPFTARTVFEFGVLPA